MRVRAVAIRNFRGIKTLDWSLSARLVCLVGAGDSGKSTVLDAISLALTPRFNVGFNDADFYGCDVEDPLTIDVTLTDLPLELTIEDQFGLWLRGVADDDTVHDEPMADDQPALTVRLMVDDSLEPTWTLFKEALAEVPRYIGARLRSAFGVFQVDDATSFHLRWSPGSALSHLSGSTDVAAMLTLAHRQARKAVFDSPLESLKEGAEKAGEVLRALGGAALDMPQPGLDPAGLGRGAALVLHDGLVPTTRLGSGSRRLASLAFQLSALKEQSVVVIDEIELGLEPHRLLHLLGVLRSRASAGRGQVLLTTHSPQVIEAVTAEELHVVRREGGTVVVRQVPKAIESLKATEPQATARSGPSAMLARRVVVCEGKTEVGLLRAMSTKWDSEQQTPLALVGTALRLGGGSEAPVKAHCMATLGYPTALVIDDDLAKHDKSAFDTSVEAAVSAGVTVFQWATGMSIEQQIVMSLPDDGLSALVRLAAELLETEDAERAICAAVGSRLDSVVLGGLDPMEWAEQSGRDLVDVRAAVGLTARNHLKGWFKDEARGERLGKLALDYLTDIDHEDHLVVTLNSIRRFAYDVEEPPPIGSS